MRDREMSSPRDDFSKGKKSPELSVEEGGIPREFAYPIVLTSEPDRYGAVGTIDVTLDWRPEYIEFSYATVPLSPKLDFFVDDHYRSLNAQIAGGGRDMRTFSIGDREIREKREKRLRELRAEEKELVEILKNKLMPIRIAFEHEIKVHVNSGTDDEGKFWSENLYSHILRWIAYSKELPYLNSKTICEKFSSQEMNEGAREATQYFREQLSLLEEREQDPEVQKMKERVEKIRDEIAIFEGSFELRIPIYLAKDMSESERKHRIDEEQEQNPRYRSADRTYHRKKSTDPLEDCGVEGTKKWYQLQGVDVDTEVIDFPQSGKSLGYSLSRIKEDKKRKEELQREENERENRESRVRPSVEEAAKKARAKENMIQETQEQKDRETKIADELTPENRKKIENKLAEVSALVAILKKIPNDTAEQKKFIGTVPDSMLTAISNQYQADKKGLDIFVDIENLEKTLKELAGRKKINEELPRLWERAQGILGQWKEIEKTIAENEDAGVILDGGAVTLPELSQRISDTFLSNPWRFSVKKIVQTEVEDIMEKL